MFEVKMFKIKDDPNSCKRCITFNNKVLIGWYRTKLILNKLENLSNYINRTNTFLGKILVTDYKSSGAFKDLQEIQIIFLKTLDNFANKNNLTYWLDFGTLIGAARNGKFIPWDDDIDVTMPRCDYARLLELQKFLPEGFYFESSENDSLIKLRNINISNKICLDIFAADFASKSISMKDSVIISSEFFKFQKSIRKKNVIERKNLIEEFFNKNHISLQGDSANSKMLVMGGEFIHDMHSTIFIPTEKIFPLSIIEFEGNEYPAPNDVFYYLTILYGDYRSPDWTKPPHVDTNKMSTEDLLKIRFFLERYNVNTL